LTMRNREMQGGKADLRRYSENLDDERNAAYLYDALAGIEKTPR